MIIAGADPILVGSDKAITITTMEGAEVLEVAEITSEEEQITTGVVVMVIEVEVTELSSVEMGIAIMVIIIQILLETLGGIITIIIIGGEIIF